MTTGDYIRNLSDEELAVFLAQEIYGINDYPIYIQEIYECLITQVELNAGAAKLSSIAEMYIKR